MRSTALFVSLAALAALAALAPSPRRCPAETPRTHEVTAEDHFTLAMVSEVAISPDGKHVAYAEGRWQQSTGDRKADLWVVAAGGGPPARLTFDRAAERALKWAADGGHVYALANRKRDGATAPPYDGSAQVWRIAAAGGEPLAVTRVAGGVDGYDLAAGAVFYWKSSEAAAGDWADLRDRFGDVEYGHGKKPTVEIHRLDLATWRADKVATLDRAVDELAAAPDGSRLAAVTAPENTVVGFEGRSEVELIDAKTGAAATLPDDLWRAAAPSPYGRLNSLAWSGDGGRLAFAVGYDGYPGDVFVCRWEAGAPAVSKLARPPSATPRTSVDAALPMRWRGDSGDLCFLASEQARVRIYCAEGAASGAATVYRPLTAGDVVVSGFDVDASGERVAAVASGPERLRDVTLYEAAGERRLTDVNPHVATWKIPKLSIVSWKGAGGTPVEGVLELPADAKAGEPLPTVVSLHGGPTAATDFELFFPFDGRGILPGRGYAVFCPNYRGSVGYGDAFVTDLVGRTNDVEVEDVLLGVDSLVAAKVADPGRLGVTGWSYGGFLTNCLVAKAPARFKAASSGAGIADQVTQWGTNDEPAMQVVFNGGRPWEKPDAWRAASPLYGFGGVKTPTLFHVGAEDPRTPPGNSRMLYRALREYSEVPTELLVYPGQGHGISAYKHREAVMAWNHAWFDRYLKGATADGK